MCTVSWRHLPEGYDLWFSRDEQRTRPVGEPPRAFVVDGTRALAPRDPLGGGTWILLNEHGVTACVLNGYGPRAQSHGLDVASRGRVPLAFARLSTVDNARQALERLLDSARFLPFHVLLVDRLGRTAGWEWDGRETRPREFPPVGMMTTSSIDASRVGAAREARFRRLVDNRVGVASDVTAVAGSAATSAAISAESLRAFHLAAEEPATAHSVRMSRSDARTVSLTSVVVRADQLAMTIAARDGDAGFSSPVSSNLVDASALAAT